MWAVLGNKKMMMMMKIFYMRSVSVWKLDYKSEPGLSSTKHFP